MNTRSRVYLGLLLIGCSLGAPASAGVRGDAADVRLGFPVSTLSRWGVRTGQWFPIQVALQLDDAEPLEVELRVESVDLDGDRVEYVRPAVTLTPGAGLQRFWCYAVAERTGQQTLEPPRQPRRLEVVHAGERVLSLDLPPFEAIAPETQLVLDVSAQPVLMLAQLEREQQLDNGFSGKAFYRPIRVGRMRAADLPDRWFGLEAIDVLVWDRPDPTQVGRSQLRAVAEWVQRGGELVIGLAGQAPLLRDTPLEPLLPIELTGETRRVREFERFFARYRPDPPPQDAVVPLEVAVGELRPAALRLAWEYFESRPGALLASWCVGAGRVTACAGSLRALLGPGVQPAALGELFDLNPFPPQTLQQELDQFALQRMPTSLFERLVAHTEFAGVGAAFVLLATLFAAAYVVAAVLVSWVWLRRLGRTAWSWPVFAGCAVVASVLSLGAVRATRGLLSSVKSVAVVDLEAGATVGGGPCWFGYRSTSWDRVALSLPTIGDDGRRDVGDNYLRPLSRGRPTNRYATPMRYAVFPERARAADVPLRATLKQFEGHWTGPLAGTFRGQLVVDRATGRVTDKSWLANDLPDAVRGGYLLYIDPRSPDEVRARTGGNVRSYRGELGVDGVVPPAHNVLALPLDQIAAGAQLRENIGAATYRSVAIAVNRWAGGSNPDPVLRPDLPTLHEAQLDSPRGPEEAFRLAALRATTRDLYLPIGRPLELERLGRPLSTAGLVDLDRTNWLQRGQALAILFVDAPGPARLHADDQPTRAQGGRTIYRVRLPVHYVNEPPPAVSGGEDAS